jgi:hypothetical protein
VPLGLMQLAVGLRSLDVVVDPWKLKRRILPLYMYHDRRCMCSGSVTYVCRPCKLLDS